MGPAAMGPAGEARPTSKPRVLRLRLSDFTDPVGQSERWQVSEVEGQRSGLTLRCEVITVQSQVVREVAARRRKRRRRRDAFRKVDSPEWGWCRWGS